VALLSGIGFRQGTWEEHPFSLQISVSADSQKWLTVVVTDHLGEHTRIYAGEPRQLEDDRVHLVAEMCKLCEDLRVRTGEFRRGPCYLVRLELVDLIVRPTRHAHKALMIVWLRTTEQEVAYEATLTVHTDALIQFGNELALEMEAAGYPKDD
jgi:hypothetical protein